MFWTSSVLQLPNETAHRLGVPEYAQNQTLDPGHQSMTRNYVLNLCHPLPDFILTAQDKQDIINIHSNHLPQQLCSGIKQVLKCKKKDTIGSLVFICWPKSIAATIVKYGQQEMSTIPGGTFCLSRPDRTSSLEDPACTIPCSGVGSILKVAILTQWTQGLFPYLKSSTSSPLSSDESLPHLAMVLHQDLHPRPGRGV